MSTAFYEDDMYHDAEPTLGGGRTRRGVVKRTAACPSHKILNPKSGVCVLRSGKVGQSLVQKMEDKKTTPRESRAQHKKPQRSQRQRQWQQEVREPEGAWRARQQEQQQESLRRQVLQELVRRQVQQQRENAWKVQQELVRRQVQQQRENAWKVQQLQAQGGPARYATDIKTLKQVDMFTVQYTLCNSTGCRNPTFPEVEWIVKKVAQRLQGNGCTLQKATVSAGNVVDYVVNRGGYQGDFHFGNPDPSNEFLQYPSNAIDRRLIKAKVLQMRSSRLETEKAEGLRLGLGLGLMGLGLGLESGAGMRGFVPDSAIRQLRFL